MGVLVLNDLIKVEPKNVYELKENIKLKQIQDAIDNNGLDEIVFEQDNKRYIAYGQKLEISTLSELKDGVTVKALYNGKPATIILFDDEINSMKEGAQKAINVTTNLCKNVGNIIWDNKYKTIAVPVSIGVLKTGTLAGGVVYLGTSALAIGSLTLGGAILGTAGMSLYGGLRSGDDSKIKQIIK